MSDKRHQPDEIVRKLRQVEVLRGLAMLFAGLARSRHLITKHHP
jgi:hypothetical protein